MTYHNEANWLEFELQMVQSEIDRRHRRIDRNVDRAHNLGKIDALRAKKNKIRQQLAQLVA
ncbi:MAG: hypothetical protein AAF724_11165 [Pseudomonadota bacterium]